MKSIKRASLFLFILVTAILLVTLQNSNAQQLNETNSTSTNSTQVNATSTLSENIGQQVSYFVHQANILFSQQKDELHSAIKQCHENIKNASPEDRKQIMDDCKASMKAINQKYQDERKQFQELFKQFRENITTLKHEANGQLSDQQKNMTINQINEKAAKNGIDNFEVAVGHMKKMSPQNETASIEHAMKNGAKAMPEMPQNKSRGETHPSSSQHPPPNSHY